MQRSIFLFLFTVPVLLLAFETPGADPGKSNPVSPLATFSAEWNQPRFLKCNTAANVPYLSAKEKEIIYILNLMRTDPKLFNRTVVRQFPDSSGDTYLLNNDYYKSLVETLGKTDPLPLLKPDKLCFESAKCHAQSAGAAGYVGHDRLTGECRTKKNFGGECCQYGFDDPLEIIMSLMIDEGVPSLGHREILLMSFNKIGVSLQPHTSYGSNTVLDLNW